MIQHENNFTFASMENETTSKQCAPISQRTKNKPMAVRTWQIDEDLMAMGMQRMDVSPMAVGIQCTGNNLRTRTAWSYQQNSTKIKCMDVSLRVACASWMEVDPSIETICPYPYDLKETRQTCTDLRATSA